MFYNGSSETYGGKMRDTGQRLNHIHQTQVSTSLKTATDRILHHCIPHRRHLRITRRPHYEISPSTCFTNVFIVTSVYCHIKKKTFHRSAILTWHSNTSLITVRAPKGGGGGIILASVTYSITTETREMASNLPFQNTI